MPVMTSVKNKTVPLDHLTDEFEITNYFTEYLSDYHKNSASKIDTTASEMNVKYHFRAEFPRTKSHANVSISKSIIMDKEKGQICNIHICMDSPKIDYPDDPIAMMNTYAPKGKDRLLLAVIEYAQENIPELKEWADKCVETYCAITEDIIRSGFREEQYIYIDSQENGGAESFILMPLNPDSAFSLDNIGYYLTESDDIAGADTLAEFAVNVVNCDAEMTRYKISKEETVSFYQAEASKIVSKPRNQRTDEEKSTLSLYEHLYKEAYGKFPPKIYDSVQPRIYDNSNNKSISDKTPEDNGNELD